MDHFTIWMLFVLVLIGIGSVPIIAEVVLRKFNFRVDSEENIEEAEEI